MKSAIIAFILAVGTIITFNGQLVGYGSIYWICVAGTTALSLFFIWVWLPIRMDQGSGKYEAAVFIQSIGSPRPLWGSRYRFSWVAQLAAYRTAIRMRALGKNFSDTSIAWRVKHLR